MTGNRPFGDFLRSRRTRLNPDKVGDATRQRRRTRAKKPTSRERQRRWNEC